MAEIRMDEAGTHRVVDAYLDAAESAQSSEHITMVREIAGGE
jgi:hypothetical protein